MTSSIEVSEEATEAVAVIIREAVCGNISSTEAARQVLAMKAKSLPQGDEVEFAIHRLIDAARMYEASCRLGGKDQEFASVKLDEARSAALSSIGRV